MRDFNIDQQIINDNRITDELVEELSCVRKTLFTNAFNQIKTEYAVKINWLKVVERDNAFWKPNCGLFASRLTQCSLEGQPTTIKFIETCFNIKFEIE